jgi:hypothetical protein
MRDLVSARVLSLGIPSAAATADAQRKNVRLDGRVQWIAGQTLVLMLDGGGRVNVDRTGGPLDSHTTLRERDRVLVEGDRAPAPPAIPSGGGSEGGAQLPEDPLRVRGATPGQDTPR